MAERNEGTGHRVCVRYERETEPEEGVRSAGRTGGVKIGKILEM